jgi:hypothetical protein
MKRLIVLISLVITCFAPLTANAQDGHIRILGHGTHTEINESSWGVAVWLIAPSITDQPSKWLAIGGPRYDGKGWNLEIMGGAMISKGSTTPIADVRLELTPKFFGEKPLYVFANPEWIGSDGLGSLYGFAQVSYVLPKGVAMIGAETENLLKSRQNKISVGPQITVPVGQLALVGAYQFQAGSNQAWLRAVINF